METASHTAAELCPECGLHLVQPINTGGLCPRCLIATAIEHLSTVDHPGLGRFGGIGLTPDIEQLNAQLPAYEFQELLGRGGAGWVFRARQISLDRQVAVKILHSGASIMDAAQRFAREAQILARLNHPRIVTVHDFGTVGESQYLVMEYVAGPTLRDVLRRPVVRENALQIADQICEAVEYAHLMGVLHRDLKPENVIFESIDRLNTLKVADFGISRLIGDTEPGFHQTQTGFVVGTPFYAAPEQMAAERPIDGRADIYSIGVMLYEMVTGHVPRGKFPPPSHLVQVPTGLDAVVLRCLESNPAKRFADVPTLRRRLHEVMSGVAKRRRLFKLAMATGAVAASLACAAVLLTRGHIDRVDKTVAQQPVAPTAPPETPGHETVAESPAPKEHVTPSTETEAPVAKASPESSLPPPAAAQPPAVVPPLHEDQYFRVLDVKVSNVSPININIHIEGERDYDQFELKKGSSLVWVVQTAGVHRIDKPFELPAGQKRFKIDEHLSLDFGDRWPIEVYIAERWYEPPTGSRKLSNSVRVPRDDNDTSPFPGPPFGRRVFPP